ncbi:hypothetical protein [Bacillus sp. TL12]|uniref:hypothetical protein n=1 Tax=Bacillus sp. TL12 TaxID=2894756 RepID=UPI001F528B69|nr:hypothetical protein [Bacillus sp. TL12]MCI0767446.1 hypothetical protein [Bacillus sp. TL12]
MDHKIVEMASYGWNKEKQCVELTVMVNGEKYIMPVHKSDAKGMLDFFWLKENKLID